MATVIHFKAGVFAYNVADKLSQKSRSLLGVLDSDKVRTECNEEILKAITPYVPMQSGTLRKSGKAYPRQIRWGGPNIPYAAYQWEGDIYRPNWIGWYMGHAQWRSPKGAGSKYRTKDKLGTHPGTVTLRPKWVWSRKYGRYRNARPVDRSITWTFGYSTPDTGYQWMRFYKEGLKSKTNKEITKKIRKAIHERNYPSQR